MAKNNNLTDFLTDVADAIRDVKGKTNLINPQDFSDEIRSIGGTGGNGDDDNLHKVTFIDYDGTELKVQFVKTGMSATPPAVPTHEYIKFSYWVGDYSNITEDTVIGAQYETIEDKSYIHHNSKYIILSVTGNNVTINWGDGNSETLKRGGRVFHTYSNEGAWWIIIEGTNVTFIEAGVADIIIYSKNITTLTGNAPQNYNLRAVILPISLTTWNNHMGSCQIRACVIPNTITTIMNYCFSNCTSMKYIALPSAITLIGAYAFNGCANLESINIPNVTTLGGRAFYNCYSLKSINITNVTSFIVDNYQDQHFRNCYSLERIISSSPLEANYESNFENLYSLKSITVHGYIGRYALRNCRSLTKLTIDVTNVSYYEIMERGLYYCYVLPSLVLKGNCSLIGQDALYAVQLQYLEIERATPPSLYSTSSIPSTYTLKAIYVPDSAVDTYKAATNWSSFASIIKGFSEKV